MHEIAEVGLGAPTAKIAMRAGVAAGTLFTYFANQEELGPSIRPEYAVVVAKLPSRYTPAA